MRLNREEPPRRDDNLVVDLARIPAQIRLIDERDGLDENEKNYLVSRDRTIDLVDETGLDLYLVNATSSPPVYRLIDYGKFRYEEQKRQREVQRRQRENARTQKEIFFSPGIGEHDTMTKVNHIRDLLIDYDIKVGMKLNRHNRMLLTSRWTKPLQAAVADSGFVLNRVIAELAQDIAPVSISVTEQQAYAILKKKL